jgi:hypothetical protein
MQGIAARVDSSCVPHGLRRVAVLLLLLLGAPLGACGGGSHSSAPPPGPLPTPAQRTDVVTYKNDLSRTGQNQTESVLTPANVKAASFGLLRTLAADGKVDATPLYLSGLTVQGAKHNVVFIASESDSVYAYDADNGALLWRVSLLGAGEDVNDMPRTAAIRSCRRSGSHPLR